MWGAAYVIEDGCSDDCFRDFRNYVISLGRASYSAALRNPDSLAAVAQDEEPADGRTPTASPAMRTPVQQGRTSRATTRIPLAPRAAGAGTRTTWQASLDAIRDSSRAFARRSLGVVGYATRAGR